MLRQVSRRCFSSVSHGSWRVHLIPLYEDNYSYALENVATGNLLLVDPADPRAVLAGLPRHDPEHILGVLTTHHHWDHAGGNDDLKALWPTVPFFGSFHEPAPGCDVLLVGGELLSIGHFRVRVMHTPCHTDGHLSFLVGLDSDASFAGEAEADVLLQRPRPGDDGQQHYDHAAFTKGAAALFCGDTLMSAGAGRFFEGDAADMQRSLKQFEALRGDVAMYCGHEYTVNNLRWAAQLMPHDSAVAERLAWAEAQRGKALPTMPSTMAIERGCNLFLRAEEDAVAEAVGLPAGSPAVDVLHALRQHKDSW
eukprot:PLAT14811.1.p1 GENE.PLAT14811.1~~PLAT14811.1.p1  ORF type:complete len:309 (-),score=109.30 PLAT14811.1:182-1108(-)